MRLSIPDGACCRACRSTGHRPFQCPEWTTSLRAPRLLAPVSPGFPGFDRYGKNALLRQAAVMIRTSRPSEIEPTVVVHIVLLVQGNATALFSIGPLVN